MHKIIAVKIMIKKIKIVFHKILHPSKAWTVGTYRHNLSFCQKLWGGKAGKN